MFKFLKKNKNKNKSNNTSSLNNKQKGVKLLVIYGHNSFNFGNLFKNCKLKNGLPIIVEQVSWKSLSLTTYSDQATPPVCSLLPERKPIPDTNQHRFRTFQPDFLLLRSLSRTIGPGSDHRNTLYGFMVSQTPSINSLKSMHFMNERPIMYAELVRLNRKHGQDKFPLIQTYYYDKSQEMIITPTYPVVVKIGHAHAGYGKMKMANHRDFGDLKSVVACTDMYCTAEKFINGKYDLRLQKIGDDYTGFKRMTMSGNWKTNTGTSHIENIEILPRYKFWMDECGKAFGGLEICTVDVIVDENDKEYIMEFNGTASGFGDDKRDNQVLKKLVIQRMNKIFCDKITDDDDGFNWDNDANDDETKDDNKINDDNETKTDNNNNDNNNETTTEANNEATNDVNTEANNDGTNNENNNNDNNNEANNVDTQADPNTNNDTNNE